MSLKALSDYTLYAKYAHYLPEKKRRETWSEIVDRVFGMHERKFKDILDTNEEFKNEFEFAKRMVKKKRVLGSQRALQFGGKWIEKENLKIYNCSATYVDRPRVFQEIMYALLCGVGMGFSVQKAHVAKLPGVSPVSDEEYLHVVQDSIEGWSDAVGVLVNSYFPSHVSEFPEASGKKVVFDYSLVRPEGSLIAGQFKAPGYKGLEKSLERIRQTIERRLMNGEARLHPVDSYDIIMHASDAVLSGGIRRAATICIFSFNDEEMKNSKTGDWFVTNPQRARSNNSAALLKDKTTREQFSILMESTKEFGEPGFIWLDDESILYNPCAEISLRGIDEDTGLTGIQVCNLTEINGRMCKSEEDFYECCRASAIIGTMQAAYTDFNYLTPTTRKIIEKEALLGCSITGYMDNPEILLNPEIQKRGAEQIKEVNKRIASMLNINQSARVTCSKPSGSTACILSTASGIHPHHARRYIRRVQVNRNEFPGQYYKAFNPLAVEKSVWSASGTDNVVSFLCEVPVGSILKNSLSAIDFLKQILLTQQNWVESGTNIDRCVIPNIRHNVSCTVVVQPDEWDEVEDFIYENRKYFAGISLLPASGDLDYPQAPFSAVLTPNEIVAEYGDASVFASGLVVDGLNAFDNNLWGACDTINGFGEKLEESKKCPIYPDRNGYTEAQYNKKLVSYYTQKLEYDEWFQKMDWIRRAKQFADRYFDGDLKRMTYCLKHVSLWKTWCDIKREHKDIDWSDVVEDTQSYTDIDTMGAQACAGGQCELK